MPLGQTITIDTPSIDAVAYSDPDTDCAAAIISKWLADPNLMPVLVPGGLEQDRLSPTQPGADVPNTATAPRKSPYATFKVEKHADPDLSTGGQYIDHRKATIVIRGQKADAERALQAARGLFIQQPLPMTGAKVVGGRAMAVLDGGATDDLVKDETRVKGEDVWDATLALHVMSHRTY